MDIKDILAAEAAKLEKPAPTTEGLRSLTSLGRELARVEREIVDTEKRLKSLKQRKNDIVHKEMPELMDRVGQDHIGLPEARLDLVLDDWFKAVLPADSEEALKWLTENGHGDLIKHQMTISLPRDTEELAERIRQRVEQMAAEFDVAVSIETKSTVPWQTLTAFVKEQVRAGAALPLETLGATVGRVVKIKKRKEK